jgi:zinc transporter ZupT
MLPEAVEALEPFSNGDHSMPYVFVLIGILATLLMDKVVLPAYVESRGPRSAATTPAHGHGHSGHGHSHSAMLLDTSRSASPHQRRSRPEDAERGVAVIKPDPLHTAEHTMHMYVLTGLLSVHSFIEGAAVGVEQDEASGWRILFAIAAHKAFAAFALGATLCRGGLEPRTLIKVMLIFASMTPLGIMLGASIVGDAAEGESMAVGVVQAIASGSFIWVACVEIIATELDRPGDRFVKFVLVCVGMWLLLEFSGSHEHGHGGHTHGHGHGHDTHSLGELAVGGGSSSDSHQHPFDVLGDTSDSA